MAFVFFVVKIFSFFKSYKINFGEARYEK